MKCKKCKREVRGDCMLTTGVCVFCHYKIHEWDSNGQLVTEKEATNYKITWPKGVEIITNGKKKVTKLSYNNSRRTIEIDLDEPLMSTLYKD